MEGLGQARLSDVLFTTNNVILETITVARYGEATKPRSARPNFSTAAPWPACS